MLALTDATQANTPRSSTRNERPAPSRLVTSQGIRKHSTMDDAQKQPEQMPTAPDISNNRNKKAERQPLQRLVNITSTIQKEKPHLLVVCAPKQTANKWALVNKYEFPEIHGENMESECQKERCANLTALYTNIDKKPRRTPSHWKNQCDIQTPHIGPKLGTPIWTATTLNYKRELTRIFWQQKGPYHMF